MTDSLSPVDFAVSVKFASRRVMLSVEGDVDPCSASELAAVLAAVIDRGHRSVGLDLNHCAFIDAAGVQAIQVAAERLRRSGGTLTVRSASVVTRQLLATAGLAELTDVDFAALDQKHRRPSSPEAIHGMLARRFGEALDTRHVIALAQGVLMERDGVSEADAYTALRRFSVKTGRPLRERAEDVAASAGRPFPDVAPRMTDLYD